MKLLWWSNVVLPGAAEALGLPVQVGGSWISGAAEGLKAEIEDGAVSLCIATPHPKINESRTAESGGVTWAAVPAGAGLLEPAIEALLETQKPDVVHIFGTEYPHNLVMLRAAGPRRTLVSIQGLVGRIAKHYTEGLPARYRRRNPVKMLMKHLYAAGVVADEQRQFEAYGRNEAAMLREARHVAGRTAWDRACLWLENPKAAYHHCPEVLRAPFYAGGGWRYETCQKHSILLTQAYYPVKGAHRLLEQMPAILRHWPDAKLLIAGQTPYTLGIPGTQPIVDFFFEYQGYLKKLCRKLDIERSIEWLGPLNAEEMKAAYLRANVLVNPSAIENSPNSVAEAMMLGLPVISSDAGGTPSLARRDSEALLYPAAESYLLPWMLHQVFDDPGAAAEMGQNARRHALETHDVAACTATLLGIYRQMTGEGGQSG